MTSITESQDRELYTNLNNEREERNILLITIPIIFSTPLFVTITLLKKEIEIS